MTCDEYLPLISGHIDGANSEFEERCLREHLQTCEACRALLAQMEQNDALLKNSKAVPPADLTERIMRQVRKEKPSSSRKKRWIPIAASGLAAAALLAVVFWQNPPFLQTSKDAAAAENAAIRETKAAVQAVDETEHRFYSTTPELAQAYDAEGVPDESEYPVATDAAITYTPNVETVTEEKSYVADFPAYGAIPDDETEDNGRPQRYASYRPSAPMLIVWGSDGLNALAESEPDDLNEYAPLTAKLAPSLFERYQAALPLLRDFDQIAPAEGFGITVYTVSYETMMAVFQECAGVYENTIYYPAAFTTPDECFVVLVKPAE